MKVSFTIPDATVDIAVAMIRAKAENQRDAETLELAIQAAQQADCVQLDSAEVFDDQKTVVLIGLAVAAVSNYLK